LLRKTVTPAGTQTHKESLEFDVGRSGEDLGRHGAGVRGRHRTPIRDQQASARLGEQIQF